MRRLTRLFPLSALLLVACQAPPAAGGSSSMAAPDSSALAATADSIRSLDRRWVQMVADHDTAGVVSMYAADGRVMPPDAPAAVGLDAIRQVWSGMLDLPSLTFGPDVIEVAASGDMAYDIGHATIGMPAADGSTHQVDGKYVVIWVKRNGQWKAMVDMFSFNQPGS
jgi:uncharacterized protein (TIGR02246 family)